MILGECMALPARYGTKMIVRPWVVQYGFSIVLGSMIGLPDFT